MKAIKELREETKGQTRMLYHLNYWDGPISGVMLWNGERCYFNQSDERSEVREYTESEIENWKKYCIDTNMEFDMDDCRDYYNYRQYKVYKTPLDIMQQLDENHNLFRRYVGIHTDYDENGSRYMGKGYLKPSKYHKKFYDRKPTITCDISKECENWDIIGKFEYY